MRHIGIPGRFDLGFPITVERSAISVGHDVTVVLTTRHPRPVRTVLQATAMRNEAGLSHRAWEVWQTYGIQPSDPRIELSFQP